MPLATVFVVVSALAAVGAPGLSGFVSEFLVFVGAYQNGLTHSGHLLIQGFTVVSALSIILGAAYMLWLSQRVFFGVLKTQWEHLTDINPIETLNVCILLFFVILIGLYPAILVDYINPASEQLIQMLPN